MILCDTNILIEFYKNNVLVVQTLQRMGQANLAISAVTQGELFFGALNKAELAKIKRHLTTIECLPIDGRISEQFLTLMETYALSHKLTIPDALIAATALVHHMDLYTFNVKDFRFIPGLAFPQL